MTTRSSNAAFVALAARVTMAAALTIASPAIAAPGAADADSARTLFHQARELRQQGDLAGALARFRSAHSVFPTPITALELGRALSDVGKLVEAREVLLSVGRLAHRADESAKSLDARAEAAQLAVDLRARIALLTLRFRSADALAAPGAVTIDGEEVPREALEVPRAVDPGRHVVFARTPGGDVRREVLLRDGESVEVTLDLPASRAMMAPATPAAPARGKEAGRAPSPIVVAGIVTAGVGTAVGAAFGIATLAKASSLKDDCADGHCPPGAHDDLHSARALGLVSTVGFVAAGIGAAVAVVGWFAGGRAAAAREPPPAAARASTACPPGPWIGACSTW